MDVTSVATASAGLGAQRLRADVAAAVTELAVDTAATTGAALVAALTETIPAGLTYSPRGLSPERTSHFLGRL